MGSRWSLSLLRGTRAGKRWSCGVVGKASQVGPLLWPDRTLPASLTLPTLPAVRLSPGQNAQGLTSLPSPGADALCRPLLSLTVLGPTPCPPLPRAAPAPAPVPRATSDSCLRLTCLLCGGCLGVSAAVMDRACCERCLRPPGMFHGHLAAEEVYHHIRLLFP